MLIQLIRHPQSTKNVSSYFGEIGIDYKITATGYNALCSLSEDVSSFFSTNGLPTIFSCSSTRCVETTMHLCKMFSLPFECCDFLRGINPGKLSGISEKCAAERYPELDVERTLHRSGNLNGYSLRFPQGESVVDFELYIRSNLFALINSISSSRHVIFVTHSSTSIHILNILYKYCNLLDDEYFYYFDIPLGSNVPIYIDLQKRSLYCDTIPV